MAGLISIILLGGFLFTRYGNERMDYMTNNEIAGVSQLYRIAPRNSLLLAAWEGVPWQFQDYEQYDYDILEDDAPNLIETLNINALVQFIENRGAPKTYLIITRSQEATAENNGLSPSMLPQFERELRASNHFVEVYSNVDAQIFLFTGP